MTTTVFACLPVLPPTQRDNSSVWWVAAKSDPLCCCQDQYCSDSECRHIVSDSHWEHLQHWISTKWERGHDGVDRGHIITLYTPTQRETLFRKNHNSLIGHYSLSPLIRPFRVFLSAEYKELYSRGLHISFKWGCTAHLPSIIMVAYNKDVASDA